MRIGWTVALTLTLLLVAPLIGGFTPVRAPTMHETVIVKSTPAGNWNLDG